MLSVEYHKIMDHFLIKIRLSSLWVLTLIYLIAFNKLSSTTQDSEGEGNAETESSEIEWSEEGVKEGKCLKRLPEHVPINLAWLEHGFLSGFYAPMGSSEYYYIYSQLLNKDGLALESQENLKTFCLRVTNGILGAEIKQVISASGTKLVGEFQNMTYLYVKSFLLLHIGFNNSIIIEDCSSGLLGMKKCKVKSHSGGLTSLINRHTIDWTVSLTDNSTFGVVLKCMSDVNARAFVVMSTIPVLPPDTVRKITKHVKKLGFQEKNIIMPSYKKCKIRSIVPQFLNKTKPVDVIPNTKKISKSNFVKLLDPFSIIK